MFFGSGFLNLIFVEGGCTLFGKQCFLRNAPLLIALGSPFLWNLFGTGFSQHGYCTFGENMLDSYGIFLMRILYI